MVTMRQSLENFSSRTDKLIESPYLFTTPKITAVLKSLTSSKIFFELITFCLDGVDFDELIMQYSITNEAYPIEDEKTLIAFGFSLLAAIDSNDINLLDLLNNNYKSNSPDRSYEYFATKFLVPWKNAIVTAAEKMIDEISKTETRFSKEDNIQESDKDDENAPVFSRPDNDGENRRYLTCYSDIQDIVSEERAKIVYTKLRENEKRDLIMLLDAFRDCLFKGTKAQIRQAFVSYKYAVQNFKKIDSGIEDIGRILKFCGIIS